VPDSKFLVCCYQLCAEPNSIDIVPIVSTTGHAENRATSGCRAWLCAGGTPRRRVAPRARSMPGSLGRPDAVSCSGYEAGRRRAIGVVAALSINPRATTPMVRRWSAGTPKRHSGPEGRGSGTASGAATRNPHRPKSPHSLGNARPTSTTLTGRLEARPHKVRPTWCGSKAEADQDPRNTAPHRGAGHGFVPEERHGGVSPPAQGPCRAPSGGPMRSAVPAMRQAAGVPSAWSQPSQSTHEPPRRWCDAGPVGRQCVTAAQKAGDEYSVRDSGR